MSLAARLLSLLVQGYRTLLSPLLPPRCRFAPTCSQYALQALQEHGALRGSWLAVRRVLRCHPFHPGGHDPVPSAVQSGSTSDAGRALSTARTPDQAATGLISDAGCRTTAVRQSGPEPRLPSLLGVRS